MVDIQDRLPSQELIAAALLVLASGCATAPPLPEIHSVSVNTIVRVPRFGIVAGGDTQRQGYRGGAIAMGAAMGDPQSPDNLRFNRYLAEHGIDVAAIVRAAFVNELQAAGLFPAVVEADGEARFDLVIERYGLGTSFDLQHIPARLRANVWLGTQLWGRDGALIWEHKTQISSWNTETPAYPEDEFYAVPGRLAEELGKVARISARELLKPLRHRKGPP